jgi:hypothetical protein
VKSLVQPRQSRGVLSCLNYSKKDLIRFTNNVGVVTIPKEVLCFKDALRQVRTGAEVLRSAKHPYNYNVGCAIRNFFKPYLCSR